MPAWIHAGSGAGDEAEALPRYDHEWEHLIDWLKPFIETEGHIGHYRYEGSELPTVLYHDGRDVHWLKVTPPTSTDLPTPTDLGEVQ